MSTYDSFWQCMIIIYDFVGLCTTMYEYVWLNMTMYDYGWLCMAVYDYLQLCMVGRCLTMYDYYMTLCDYVRLCRTLYENV